MVEGRRKGKSVSQKADRLVGTDWEKISEAVSDA
jgi:hypothetical protein